MKALRIGVAWIFALLAGFGALTAQAAESPPDAVDAVYALGPDISGTWYDPAQNGQGFVIQHIVSNGQPALLATWFTYLDGKARWLIGVGTPSGSGASIPLSITSGADFPPRFVASAAQIQPWGQLVLNFADKNRGTATWTSSFAGFNNGSMPIERLTTPSTAFEATTGQIAACHSGSWYDPAQNGHGIFTEVLGSGANRQMLAIWYAYLNGEQRWMTALGPITGNTATMTATITSGADFPPAFRPGDVVSQPWGTMTFTGVDADHASWTWNSTVSGFGSGALNLTRLSALSGSDCGPSSDKHAARFLTQASFGPTTTDIASVRTLGYAGWIDAQMALAPTLNRPTIETQIATQVLTDPRNAQFYRAYRLERWFNTAMYAPDQLRQRVAFALSQILVLSEVGALDNNPIGVAEYNDILLRGAFGNYRDLLREVTLSPMMGAFLTHLRNQKTDWTLDAANNLVAGLIQPDENYAREVMQLFSIGLVERNRDFSPILSGGQTTPTYTQDLVTNTARVLTGHAYACTGPATIGTITLARNCGTATGTAAQFSTTLFFSTPGRYAIPGTVTALAHPDTYKPMVCYPRYADTGRSATGNNNYAVLPAPNDRKTLLAGISIGPSPVACYTSTPAIDQQACIDYCNGQMNTLLDSLFNHPNVPPMVSRQLIQRLTTSNPSAGYIDRVAAVFENDGAGVRGNLGAVVKAILLDPEARTNLPAANFGKLREPLLRLTAIYRAFGVQNGTNGANGLSNIERGFPQAPLRAPSVFNFYEPDYQQPGEIADSGLYSPEFEILNESTFIMMSDEFWRRIFTGYTTTSATTTPFTTPTNAAFLPATTIDAVPTAHDAMVETLNQRLLNGAMSDSMRAKLVALLNTSMASADHRRKVLSLIHLIAISSEFAVQQ
ncbi:MAG: DUF1800 family protein [Rhodanobacteraceae bacterium]|nr:DUF1800 family protein [Rhodanobacteraceae bacterium]